MKNLLIVLYVFIFSINGYSQIAFEKGYYITNDGKKIDCLIKDMDWADSPTKFNCKLSENGEVITCTINDVNEFGISNSTKFIRRKVELDRSSESLSDMSSDKHPLFQEEVVFLKYLLEGKASLYMYESGSLARYFYSSDSTEIEPLVYKSYKTKENKIGKNNTYKVQLWTALKCPNVTLNMIENLHYRRNELIDLFVAYNYCSNHEVTNYYQRQKKDLFNLNIRPGINYSSLSILHHDDPNGYVDFGTEFGGRLGIEGEFFCRLIKRGGRLLLNLHFNILNQIKILVIRL